MPEEVSPVPLTGPDYLALAVIQTASDLLTIPGFEPRHIRRQGRVASSIAGLYFSKSFPITYGDFCHRVADFVEQELEVSSEEEA